MAAVFSLCLSLMLWTYARAQLWCRTHAARAWEVAEEVADGLLAGERVPEGIYAEVKLISRDRVLEYSMGRAIADPLATAYTYRLLENGTLLYVRVWIGEWRDLAESRERP